MEKVKVFRNNGVQSIRLLGNVSFPDTVTEVDIIRLGRSRLITPVGEVWDSWFDGEGVTDDFMNGRHQIGNQKRERF